MSAYRVNLLWFFFIGRHNRTMKYLVIEIDGIFVVVGVVGFFFVTLDVRFGFFFHFKFDFCLNR